MFRFIHAADVHIDSPLRGLQAYDDAPTDQLRKATRDAFAKVMELAIDEQVDFVIVAGDLFDGKWLHMETGLWTAAQFRRLEQENIAVYLIRGNHDALSKVRQAVSWPENVREFSVGSPQTFHLESLGVALHGQGFAKQQCEQDLAANYPKPLPDCFNIGVLHTSLAGSSDHDTYAPTSEETLVNRGYDYWALGHVHMRSAPPIRQRPYIVYSGNTQGRHIKEVGPKGCLLVAVDDGEINDVAFHETDTVRWTVVEVALSESDGLSELTSQVHDQLAAAHEAAGGRICAARVVVRGACAAHQQLVHRLHDETIAEIRNLAGMFDDEVWVEKVILDTTTPVDVEQLRQGADLMGDLLRDIESLHDTEAELVEIAHTLSPLFDRAAVELSEAGIDFENIDQLRQWLRRAEGMLISQLSEVAE